MAYLNKMAIKIIVCGALGKMGQRIVSLAEEDKELEIVGLKEVQGHPSIGKEILPGITLTDDLSKIVNKADVVIDFTNPSATLENVRVAAENGKSLVIGTTGISDEQKKEIEKMAMKIPILLSPNMSIGVNIFFRLANWLTPYLKGYDVEIVEAHHNQKKDAPSGTAAKLAQIIADALNIDLNKSGVYGREGLKPRKLREIGIHAVRAGDIVGEHTVIFAGKGERIEIIHRAYSRDTFAAGALRAAKWIVNQKPGLYTMENLLGVRS